MWLLLAWQQTATNFLAIWQERDNMKIEAKAEIDIQKCGIPTKEYV
jgi:hypothetical protein